MQRSNFQIDLEIPDDLDRLSQDVELAAFRIVQECLVNVLRHSGSQKVEIALIRNGDELGLSVRDYGKGLLNHVEPGNMNLGVGLRGIAERVRQLRGSLEIQPAHPGTRVEVWLPRSADNAADAKATSGAIG